MPVKTITAEIDGQVRKITADIPDDATQEEIMSAVSSYKSTASVAQSKPQGMIDRVMNARGMEGGDPMQTLKAMGVKAGNEYDAKRNSDNQIEAVRPYSIGPAVALGTRAAAMTPGPIPLKAVVGAAAGGSAYFGLDTLLKNLESDPSQASDSVSNLALNVVMGKAIEKGISGGRAFIAEMNNPGSVVGKMARLFPTFSQMKDSKLASMFEDFFATKSKTTAIERSAQIGKAEAEVMATGSTKTSNLPAGRPIAEIRDPHIMAANVQKSAVTAEATMQAESNLQADTVKAIARTEPKQIITNQQPLSLTDPQNRLTEFVPAKPPMTDATGNIIPGVAAVKGRVIAGPIQLNGTIEEAQNYLLDTQRKWGDITKNVNLAPADERPLINAAQNIIKVTDTVVDKETGAIVSHNPVSFEDAWNFKKLSDGAFKTNPRAANISRALNNDIDNSITSWQSPDKNKALASWQSSKKIVGDRIALFERDANGQLPTLGRLINQVDGSPIGTVDDIIRDPVKLQRALTLNEVKFPNGTVKSTNMRGDLRGYHTQQLFDSAWVNESANSTKQVFSASKIMDEINDPRMQKSLSLLYPGTARDNLTEFVTELAKTQQKMAVAGPWIKYVMPIRGGIALTAGLATGAMSGSGIYGGAITGLVLGGSAVARLMTNPTTARLMIALAKGQKLGSDVWMSRTIASALQGSHAALTVKYQDGNQIRSELDKDNKFQPIE